MNNTVGLISLKYGPLTGGPTNWVCVTTLVHSLWGLGTHVAISLCGYKTPKFGHLMSLA